MWIIDPRIGLVSVVVADDQFTGKPSTDRIMLRSRRRAHLQNLKSLCPALADTPITAARKDLDYPVRLVVDRAVFVEVLAELGRKLAYRNVKAEAHRHEAELGAGFVAAMHRVHATLAQIDDREGDGPAR
jgi:hypothetical protein